MEVPVADGLRRPCIDAALPVIPETVPTNRSEIVTKVLRPVMTFSLAQEGTVRCERSRASALLETIDAYNEEIAEAAAKPPARRHRLF